MKFYTNIFIAFVLAITASTFVYCMENNNNNNDDQQKKKQKIEKTSSSMPNLFFTLSNTPPTNDIFTTASTDVHSVYNTLASLNNNNNSNNNNIFPLCELPKEPKSINPQSLKIYIENKTPTLSDDSFYVVSRNPTENSTNDISKNNKNLFVAPGEFAQSNLFSKFSVFGPQFYVYKVNPAKQTMKHKETLTICYPQKYLTLHWDRKNNNLNHTTSSVPSLKSIIVSKYFQTGSSTTLKIITNNINPYLNSETIAKQKEIATKIYNLNQNKQQ